MNRFIQDTEPRISALPGFNLAERPVLDCRRWTCYSGIGTFGHFTPVAYNYSHLACIDSLGEAKRLVSYGDGMLELTTVDGSYLVWPHPEPAFSVFGFVRIASAGLPSKGAYYFDVRVAAAVFKHSNRGEKAEVLPLMSEDESWEVFREREHPGGWACEQVFHQATWTDKSGVPLWNPETDKELYDLRKLENRPRSLATLPKRLSHLAKLDYRLRKCVMMAEVDIEYKKLYTADPYEYMREMNALFLQGRMSQYESLCHAFENVEQAEGSS